MKSAGKAFLFSLLLLCVSMHSGVATVINVTGNEEFENPYLCGCSYFKFQVYGARATVSINNMMKTDSFVSLLFNEYKWANYAPLTISVTNFVMRNAFNCLYHMTTKGTMVNYTRGTATGYADNYGPFHFTLSPTVSPGFTVYIHNFTSTFSPSARGDAISLGLFNMKDFSDQGIQIKTGFYMTRIKTTYANSLLARESQIQLKNKTTGYLEHIGTISVTDSECVSCADSFYRDNTTNVIEYGLIRFQNCIHDGTAPFYAQINDTYGDPGLNLRTNSNLVISNVTTNGPLFSDGAYKGSVISSTSRLTLHRIKAASLYSGTPSDSLFASVPAGAQIYLGPMNFAGQDVSSLGEYKLLNIPFTRVTDANRKVLFLPDGKARADVGDNSQVGEFSASHCVNDGYYSISSVKVSFNSDVYEAKCMCNADRFVPHCTATWDPLGESLCPINMSMSLTQKVCVSCSIPRCSRCDVADQCAECEEYYRPVEDKSECAYYLDHCKVISKTDPSKCAECDPGFSLTVNGKCVTTIPDCVSYSDNGRCLSCDSGLSPSYDGTACVNCHWENCAQCYGSGECRFCKDNYTLVDGECIECFIEGCIECYKPNVCGHCELEGGVCVIGGEQDTSKGIPWWVWLIVGLAAAVVVGLIIFFIVWCCCCKQEEYFVTYQEQYNEAEEKNGDRDMRLWDRNGSMSGSEHGAVFMMNDNVRPRIFKQDENNTHGDGSSFASSDSSSSSSSTSSSRKSATSSSDSGSSTDSGRGK